MSKTIAVVGSSFVDFTMYSHRLPKPGETYLGKRFEQGFGGKGANQCVTAARLGASTVFVTSIGSDNFGQEYLEKLKQDNIDLSHVTIQNNCHSGVSQITVTETGENAIVAVLGANELLSRQDVSNAKDKIQAASVLLCQFETTLEATLEALQLFKGHGTSIVNGAPAVTGVDPDIFKLSDIFCVNETEAEVLTGLDNLTLAKAQSAVDTFFDLGCNTVIITFGAEGAVYASRTNRKVVHVPSVSVKAVDTTAAGDAFLGALAYFLLHHSDLQLEECIRRSNMIAAVSVMKNGAQTSLPYKKHLPKELFQPA